MTYEKTTLDAIREVEAMIDGIPGNDPASIERRLARQMDLPAFIDNGTPITLASALHRFRSLRLFKAALDGLPDRDKRSLTTSRLSFFPDFKVVFVGDTIDMARAIREVNGMTNIGKQLVDVEMIAVAFAFERAKKAARAKK
jgi:hypothetical protein